MKNKVKITKFLVVLVSLIFVACFIMSFSLPSNIFASTSSTVMWKNNISSTLKSLPSYGSGYAIKTSQDLAYWSDHAASYKNSTITLMNSIDMGSIGGKTAYFTPIAEFNGTFNGNGFSISGLNIWATDGYAGLFGKFGGAKIQNLKLKNVKFYNVGEYDYNGSLKFAHIGGIAACAAFGTIENCIVDNTGLTSINFKLTTTTSHLWFGGIVGRIISPIKISSCFTYGTYNFDSIYNGTILNWATFGGVVGEMIGTTIQTAESNTTISGVNNIKQVCGGGIVGKISSSSTVSQIKESCNYGNVRVGDSTNTNIAYCGGIVGHVSVSSTIKECFNVGNISAYGNGKSCVETKTIEESEYAFSETSYTFKQLFKKSQTCTFKKGSLSGGFGRENIYAGGLAGYLDTSSSMTCCYNSGNVSSNSDNYIYDHVIVYAYNGGSLCGTLNVKPRILCNVNEVLVGNEGVFSGCSNNYNSNNISYGEYSVNTGVTSEIRLNILKGSVLGVCGRIANDEYNISAYFMAGGEQKGFSLYYFRDATDFPVNYIKPTSTNVTDLITVSDKFVIKEGVNNGKPLLKNVYWENSTVEPSSLTK